MCVVCVFLLVHRNASCLTCLSIRAQHKPATFTQCPPPKNTELKKKQKQKKKKQTKKRTFLDALWSTGLLLLFKAKQSKTKQTKCQVSASKEWPELWDELPFNSDTGFVLETCNHSILSLKRKEKRKKKRVVQLSFFLSPTWWLCYFPPGEIVQLCVVVFFVCFFFVAQSWH